MTLEITLLATSSAFICLAAASVWFLVCNNRTLNQRLAIIRSWRLSVEYWKAELEFEQVSYDRHLWSLFFFRDPISLYGHLTKAAYAGLSK